MGRQSSWSASRSELQLLWSPADFVEPLLFDVKPRDPAVFGAVAIIVFVIGVFAAWWPARRASRVDPMVALRTD